MVDGVVDVVDVEDEERGGQGGSLWNSMGDGLEIRLGMRGVGTLDAVGEK